MNLIVIILDDLERLPALLAAWRELHVGATLLTSQGGYRVSNWLDRVGLGGLRRILSGQAIHEQRVLFSIIADADLLERAIAEAERVLGGFDRPDSGILFVVSVGRALGLGKPAPPQGTATPANRAPRLGIDPQTPVTRILEILHLQPFIVLKDRPVEELIHGMVAHPSVNVVGVVNEEERLVGLIDTNTLSEAMFFNIFPEAFLAQLNDKDTVLEFLKRPHAAHTAGDIMQPPEFVHLDDTILRAFQVLQKRRLEGIPVVDRHNRVRGYIHLLELMEVCTREAPAGRGAP